jgi:hypothetical protein
MTKSDMRALMKGLQKKALADHASMEVLESVDEILAVLADLEDEEQRIEVPYVNAMTITTGTWK